jgi:hypothetical protein
VNHIQEPVFDAEPDKIYLNDFIQDTGRRKIKPTPYL